MFQSAGFYSETMMVKLSPLGSSEIVFVVSRSIVSLCVCQSGAGSETVSETVDRGGASGGRKLPSL